MMKIGGDTIMLISGIVNLTLISLQLAGGLRWIRIPIKVHRKTGIFLFVAACIHAAVGILIL
jgi:hypothetical protein